MNIFDTAQVKTPARSSFDLSHEVKMSLDMGILYPILTHEIVPGDTFSVNSEVFLRMSPLIAPVMHRVNVFVHYFFVPNRLIWDKWERFITGGTNDAGENEPEPLFPEFTGVSNEEMVYFNPGVGLPDYLGFPTTQKRPGLADFIPYGLTGEHISKLPFRAYQLIYNEYYRDQNLMGRVAIADSKHPDTVETISQLCRLRHRCWEKDYFTSALPWAAKGGDVQIPSGSAALLTSGTGRVGTGVQLNPSDPNSFYPAGGGSVSYDPVNSSAVAGSDDAGKGVLYASTGAGSAGINLSGANGTIRDLRRASALQRWLERTAIGGSRYIEQNLVHFGVKSSDSRLQRPEYLGGGMSPVQISEVLQTSESSDVTPQGNMAGHGIAVGNTNRFKRYFEEHGWIMGIMSVMPRTSYQQGLPRQYQKREKLDYYFPEFAEIGEQAIKNNEVWKYDNSQQEAYNEGTFGYTPRYAEYKQIPSRVCGDFKDTLNYWHMGRVFGYFDASTPSGRPELNWSFVEARPTKRIFAVEGIREDESDPEDDDFQGSDFISTSMYAQVYHSIHAVRPMPYFGTPTLF